MNKKSDVPKDAQTQEKNTTKPNERQLILAYMRTHDGITTLESLYNGMGIRLASRICELRQSGIGIRSDYETKNGKTYVRYRLEEENELQEN